jgi:hypothetical protein
MKGVKIIGLAATVVCLASGARAGAKGDAVAEARAAIEAANAAPP